MITLRYRKRMVLLTRQEATLDPQADAVALAYLPGHHTMAAVANQFGVQYTTVSGLMKKYEAGYREYDNERPRILLKPINFVVLKK